LLECRLLGGNTYAAQETANFLLEVAQASANADLKKRVLDLLHKSRS